MFVKEVLSEENFIYSRIADFIYYYFEYFKNLLWFANAIYKVDLMGKEAWDIKKKYKMSLEFQMRMDSV